MGRARGCYAGVVAQLNEQQARALQPIVGRHLRFYGKLCNRLDKLGISGELRTAIYDVHNEVHKLSVKLHYATCESGVAK